MNQKTLACAILHADASIAATIKEYIGRIPGLSLCGTYAHPMDALSDYYKQKVELYFVGLSPATEQEEIGGMDFCRFLSPDTRVRLSENSKDST